MLLPLAVLALAGCQSQRPHEAARPAESGPVAGTVLDGKVPSRLLNLPLVDHAGHRRTIGSYKGRVVVVSDMSTLCQETCAIGTASMVQAARALDRAGLADRVEFLSITLDPSRDDRRHIAAYRRQFGELPNWETMTGDPQSVDYLWDTLGVWRRSVRVSPPYQRDWVTGQPLTTDIQHTDDLVFLDEHQRFRFLLDGPGRVASPRLVPRRIYAFMDDTGHQNVRAKAGAWSAHEVEQVVRWLTKNEGASR